MRERFDFSSVSKILLANNKADGISYTEYYNAIFHEAYLKLSDEFDSENAGKIINGERKIPHKVLKQYRNDGEKNALRKDILRMLNRIHDLPYVAEQLSILLWQDDSISTAQNERMQRDSDKEFITNCLIYAIDRKFVSNEEKSRTQFGTKLILSDYLLDTRLPSPSKVFLGRSHELSSIHEHLQNEPVLFLSGIGGIGKSELAKQYVKQYKKTYSSIIFLHYEENLRQTICNLDFVDDAPNINPDAQFEMHYRLFKVLPSDALVVLDNFDALPEEDELFNDFLSLSFHLLITTRNHIADEPCYTVNEIASDADLLELFYAHAPCSKTQPDVVTRIIDEVFRHTLTAEMAAKTITASGITPEQLLLELQTDRLGLSNPNQIRVKKDEKTTRDTLRGHMETLFRLQALSQGQQHCLQLMLLMPNAGISKALYLKLLQATDANLLNKLIDYGWIAEDVENAKIFMHPLLCEVALQFTPLAKTQYQSFAQSLEAQYQDNAENARELLAITKRMLSQLNGNADILSSSYFCNALAFADKYVYWETMSSLLDAMQSTMHDDTPRDIRAIYEFNRGKVALFAETLDCAHQHFDAATDFISPVTRELAPIALEIYTSLTLYYLIANPNRVNEYLKLTEDVSRKLQLENPFGTEITQFIQSYLQCYHTSPNISLKELMNSPMVGQLMQFAESMVISQADFIQGIQALVPSEILSGLASQIHSDFTGMFQAMQSIDLSAIADKLHIKGIFRLIIDTALQHLKLNAENETSEDSE